MTAQELELVQDARLEVPEERWTYQELMASFDGQDFLTEASFDAFTAEIEKGLRCTSCGGVVATMMEDEWGEIVHYDCGQAWS